MVEAIVADRDRLLARLTAVESTVGAHQAALIQAQNLTRDLRLAADSRARMIDTMTAQRDEALMALDKARLERDAARRERDEVRAEVIPELDDRDRWKMSCIASGVDHTTEHYKAIDTLAAQRAEAREAVVHASEAMHRALHELSHGVAGNPFASIVPRASQILQEGIARLAL